MSSSGFAVEGAYSGGENAWARANARERAPSSRGADERMEEGGALILLWVKKKTGPLGVRDSEGVPDHFDLIIIFILWLWSRSRALRPLLPHMNPLSPCTCLELSVDSAMLVTGHLDGAVCLWQVVGRGLDNTPSTTMLHHWEHAHASAVERLCVLPPRKDQQLHVVLVSAGSDGRVCMWDLQTGASFGTLCVGEAHLTAMVRVAGIERHGVVATLSVSRRILNMWETRFAPTCTNPLSRPLNNCVAAALAPNAATVALALHDSSIRVVDVISGRQLARFKGHTRWATALVYTVILVDKSSRVPALLSASRDGTVCLWDIDVGELVATFDYTAISGEGGGLCAAVKQLAFERL